MKITPYVKLRIKQVESRSNWFDLVHVISAEACLTQGDLFWHYPTKSQMQLGTQALCSSGGVSVPLPHVPPGQTQFIPGSSRGFCKACRSQLRGGPKELALSLAKVKWDLETKRSKELR